MKLTDFDYNLPSELIADRAIEPRDHSKLLVLNRHDGTVSHDCFFNLIDHLVPGDVIIVNNSKVFPARLIGKKEITGGRVEIFLNKEVGPGLWEVVGRGLKVGMRVVFEGSALQAGVEKQNDNIFSVRFNMSGDRFFCEIENIGEVPLPPYIVKKRQELDTRATQTEPDKQRYQTVYAKDRGSVAAPTAGLHFTPELIKKIKEMGVEVAEVTLHVGLGTFTPIKEEEIEQHKIHSEYFSVDKETLEQIARAKRENRRIVAVGTTTTRVLEHVFSNHLLLDASYELRATSGHTNIYIYPGYKFKCIDGLITNFHLPKSSLLVLVAAFAGRDLTVRAYEEAIREKYRFYSYGDAMLIV
ncbi:MAG: tRNA preQ1(34) S-adenosylmethionine ribosyltransferase-isomerase QueA [Patescibacteria group bacterium]|jgi:S-adenosylmethionine:tRNA ribosyltransferase-isomerase